MDRITIAKTEITMLDELISWYSVSSKDRGRFRRGSDLGS